MNRQTVTFTALPNGVTSNGRLRLSVLVAPFLVLRQRIDDPRGLPGLARLAEPRPDLPGAVRRRRPGPATRVGPAPRSDLWTSLFGAGAQVDPSAHAVAAAIAATDTSDGEGSIFATYDTRFVHRWLKDTYAEFATTSPEEFPTLAPAVPRGRAVPRPRRSSS